MVEEQNHMLFSLILKGEYNQVISQLRGKVSTLEEVWYLGEAFLQLDKLDNLEQILQQWKDKLPSEIDQSKWYLYHGRYLVKKGATLEAIQAFNSGKELLKSTPNKELLAEFKLWTAISLWYRGSLEQASKLAYESLEIFETLSSKNSLVSFSSTLNLLGNINADLGEKDLPLDYYQRSLSIREKIGNPKFIGKSLNNIALVWHSRGCLDKTLKYHYQALSKREITKNPDGIALTLNNLATVLTEQGEMRKALEYFQRAQMLWEQIGSPLNIGIALNNIGVVYRDQGDYTTALGYFERALTRWKEADNPRSIAEGVVDIAITLASQGKLSFDTAVLKDFPAKPYKTPRTEAYHHIIQALLAQGTKEWQKAKKEWQKALDNNNLDSYYKIYCHEALTELAFIEWRSKAPNSREILEKCLSEWESLCRANSLTPSLCKLYILRGKLSAVEYQISEAKRHYHKCLVLAGEMGLPLHQRLAQQELLKLRTLTKGLHGGLTLKGLDEGQVEEFMDYLKKLSKFLNQQNGQ